MTASTNAEVQRLRAFLDDRKRSIKAAEKRYDIQTAVNELRELAAPLSSPGRFSPTWKDLYLEVFYRDVAAFVLGFVAVHLEICLSDQDRDQAFDVFFARDSVPPSRAIAALTAALSATKIGANTTDIALEQDVGASITQCIRLLEKAVQTGGLKDVEEAMLQQEQSLLPPVFEVVLDRWSQGDFATTTEYSVNSAVCFFLRYSLQTLTKNDGGAQFSQSEWITKLCKGVQDHMSNSLERVRILGMRVAESLSQVISPEKPLDFGLDKDDSLAIYGCPVEPEEVDERVADLNIHDSLDGEEVQQSLQAHTVDGSKARRKKKAKPFSLDPDELAFSDDEDAASDSASDSGDSNSFNDAESDSDMSLEAYDLHDDEEDLTAKKPLYLKDLVASLLSDDDREKTEAALIEAESLLRRRPRDLNDKAQEVVRALLRLEDKYSMPHFVKLRSQALIATCVLAPAQTLPYLCSQALEREQLLQSRIDVLQTMTSAAQELSERGGGYQRPRGPKTLLHEQVGSASGDNADDIGGLEERTMQKLKTRRWGYRRDPLAAPKKNAFEPYALAFFSPLLFGYVEYVRKHSAVPGNRRSEVEQTFLAHLLHALASFVECAGHSPQTVAMAKCLLEFAWNERTNTSAEVRRQVLFSVSRVLLVIPPALLRQEVGDALAEVSPWLNHVLNHDPDAGCREAARLLSSFAIVPALPFALGRATLGAKTDLPQCEEASWEMATVDTADASPVSSAKLTELGKALDQASISSSTGAVTSPASTHEAPPTDGQESADLDEEDDDEESVANEKVPGAPAAKLPAKSPKKRGRTDSLKKMLPAPASQRHKQVRDAVMSSPQSSMQSSSEDSAASTPIAPAQETVQQQQRPQQQPAKLMVKDRRGSGMGVPRAHLILNAVKQAPPAKEKSNPRRWSKHEDESLRLAVERSGERNWKAIADQVPGRNHTQCLQRWTKVLKPGLIKGHWTPEEDAKLRDLVAEGKKNWGQVASLIPGRTSYTEDEDKIIVEMQAKLGNRWSIIAQQLKGRTEDAVKIRWKSLMRGRRAASKEEKTPTASTAATPVVSASALASSPSAAELPKTKVSKASPARPKIRASGTATATDTTPPSAMKSELEAVPENRMVLDVSSVSNMPGTVFVKGPQGLAPTSQPDMATAMGANTAAMQNVNELVAASIHNFRMSQGFHPSPAAHGSNPIYAGNPSQMMSAIAPSNQQPVPVYTMADGGMGGYTMNLPQQQHTPLQQHPPQQHLQQQQGQPPYQYPPGYPLQQHMGVVPSYAVPPNFPTSTQMQMPMQMSMPMHMPSSSSMHPMPPTPTYASQAMAMAMANTQYQQQSQQPVHQGFSGAPLHPRAAGTPSGMSAQPVMMPVSNTGSTTTSNTSFSNVSGAGLPPSSASAAAGASGKGLNTPREEWGSSQTPRSQMILTEGHASAYELFHQQRLRLMLQERDKQGMTLSSAPSPGQALLTKELEANKERQARQAIMQKGWKSAVDAMVSFNGDISALDDQQRFDGLLEKVSLSALDPTDDELLDQTVDIISGDDTVDL
ncbi:TEL2, telomere maintenance protein 2 [Phytophthora boehmeriae]|uniref:TEL2, telomere maintenance protein 2 n=1 Tax=Phytophthora boehmeriae TaxID=109152 RepID=A0A8T1XE57_9STRA|nr:TEL2, telomere maintenance protein 2 [Phytophthora boehmeriae]